MQNLFNASYGDPGGDEHTQMLIMQDSRSLRGGVRIRF
jgi:hypothetical protein